MNEIDKFAQNLNRTIEQSRQAQLRFVICKSVDWDSKTMTATGVSDDVDYEEVQLGFGYVDIQPAKDSLCLIGIIEGKEALTFLINAEYVELAEIKAKQITYNDGKNDGLVKIRKLDQNLNNIKTYLDSLNTAIATGLSSTVANGGVAASTAFTTTMESIPLNYEDMENENIKH